jgi:hypothetical protein
MYSAIPGCSPPRDWQSLPWAGEKAHSNPGLQLYCQVVPRAGQKLDSKRYYSQVGNRATSSPCKKNTATPI